VEAGVRQRVFEITISTKAEVLETLHCGCSSLGRAARHEPVFILRAQHVLAPRVVVRWAHLAEQHKIRCAARWRSLSKSPTGKQRTRSVFRCRTDSSVASIYALHRRYTTLDPPFENMLPMHRGGHPLCAARTMNELLAHGLAPVPAPSNRAPHSANAPGVAKQITCRVR
jgi:hypothetical protein